LNAKSILRDVIIERLREDPLHNWIGENSQLRDILPIMRDFYKFFGWSENQSVDEVALKVWLFEKIFGALGGRIASIPLSILFLEKGEEYYNRVNERLEAMDAEHVISLFRRRRLKILEDGVFFDDKKLEGELLKLPQTRGVLELIYIVGRELEQEEIESRNAERRKLVPSRP